MAHVPRVLAARIRDQRPTRAWTRPIESCQLRRGWTRPRRRRQAVPLSRGVRATATRRRGERAAKRRTRTEKARRKADERSQNMPSKALLRQGRSQVTSNISTAQAATGRSRRRTPGPQVVPIRTLCESCAAQSEVLETLWSVLTGHCLWIRGTHSARLTPVRMGQRVASGRGRKKRCPRCQSHHNESSDEEDEDDMDVDMDKL